MEFSTFYIGPTLGQGSEREVSAAILREAQRAEELGFDARVAGGAPLRCDVLDAPVAEPDAGGDRRDHVPDQARLRDQRAAVPPPAAPGRGGRDARRALRRSLPVGHRAGDHRARVPLVPDRGGGDSDVVHRDPRRRHRGVDHGADVCRRRAGPRPVDGGRPGCGAAPAPAGVGDGAEPGIGRVGRGPRLPGDADRRVAGRRPRAGGALPHGRCRRRRDDRARRDRAVADGARRRDGCAGPRAGRRAGRRVLGPHRPHHRARRQVAGPREGPGRLRVLAHQQPRSAHGGHLRRPVRGRSRHRRLSGDGDRGHPPPDRGVGVHAPHVRLLASERDDRSRRARWSCSPPRSCRRSRPTAAQRPRRLQPAPPLRRRGDPTARSDGGARDGQARRPGGHRHGGSTRPRPGVREAARRAGCPCGGRGRGPAVLRRVRRRGDRDDGRHHRRRDQRRWRRIDRVRVRHRRPRRRVRDGGLGRRGVGPDRRAGRQRRRRSWQAVGDDRHARAAGPPRTGHRHEPVRHDPQLQRRGADHEGAALRQDRDRRLLRRARGAVSVAGTPTTGRTRLRSPTTPATSPRSSGRSASTRTASLPGSSRPHASSSSSAAGPAATA